MVGTCDLELNDQKFETKQDVFDLSTRFSEVISSLEKIKQDISDKIGSKLSGRADRYSGNCDQSKVALYFARHAILAREMRDKIFGADMFQDPMWNILLELYIAYGDKNGVTVGNACIAAAVPHSSALRCCAQLQAKGLVMRERDSSDGRRVLLRLTEAAFEDLTRILSGGREPAEN